MASLDPQAVLSVSSPPAPSGPAAWRQTAPDPAREAVIRLSRAVQRAAIYPAEHPSVRLALGPFLDGLNQLVRDGQRLLMVVMRDRLVVSTGDEPPREHQTRWLAAQLYARRITSLTFETTLDAEECLGFIDWLAQPAKQVAADPPAAPGIRFTRLDYSQAQFDETPRTAGDEPPEAIAAWNALAVGLVPPGAVVATAEGRIEPLQVAHAIEADLAAAEGTGVTSITGRLIRAGGGIAALPETDQRVVRERLAEVVTALPDEIRRQILAVVPDDHPDKIAFLSEILEALPRQRLLELVPRVDMTPGAHVRQFLTFLVKLVSIAHVDPAVSEAVEDQLARHGLPAELLQAGAESGEELLAQLFNQAAGQLTSTGERYQASLRDLGPHDSPAADDLDLSAYGRADSAEEIATHVAEIAIHLVRLDGRDPSTPACLARARDAARRDLDAGRIDLLAAFASCLAGITGPVDAVTRQERDQGLALCAEPRVAERLVAALDAHAAPSAGAVAALFVACGVPVATLAVMRISELPDGPLRDRFGHLLARVDLGVLRLAVAAAQRDGAAVAQLLVVFRSLDPARTPELARTFLKDADPSLRRQALEVLCDAPLAPIKKERIVVRALGDEDAGVVRVALRELSASQTPPGLAAITAFLARTQDAALEPLQVYAVQSLRQAWTPRAADALIPALLARRSAFDPAARRVSRTMVAALDEAGDDAARRVARAWRRSPAGLWSACVGEGPGATR